MTRGTLRAGVANRLSLLDRTRVSMPGGTLSLLGRTRPSARPAGRLTRVLSSGATMLLVVLQFGACDSTTGPTVLQRYALESIGGELLPFPVAPTEAGEREITAGHIDLKQNGFFEDRTTYRTYSGTSESRHDVRIIGSYSLVGTTMTFNPLDGVTYTGTLDGDVLTITTDETVWVYRLDR